MTEIAEEAQENPLKLFLDLENEKSIAFHKEIKLVPKGVSILELLLRFSTIFNNEIGEKLARHMHTLICCNDEFRVQFGYNLTRLYSLLY